MAIGRGWPLIVRRDVFRRDGGLGRHAHQGSAARRTLRPAPRDHVAWTMFDPYLRRWELSVDGAPRLTPRARLLPVRYRGVPAMLKVATTPEEVVGNAVLAWWGEPERNGMQAPEVGMQREAPGGSTAPERPPGRQTGLGRGTGAARVLAIDGPAVLMVRAAEPGTLMSLVEQGREDDATDVLLDIASALHAPRSSRPPDGVPSVEAWFAPLASAAQRLGGPLHASSEAATRLLRSLGERVVLHGDLHHENVLRFEEGGWLAIDPKGIIGERALDHVHHVYDPDDPEPPSLEEVERRLARTANRTGADPARLRLWLLALAGLQATWWLGSGGSPATSLAVAAMVAGTVASGRAPSG